jgi:hypothetical protein
MSTFTNTYKNSSSTYVFQYNSSSFRDKKYNLVDAPSASCFISNNDKQTTIDNYYVCKQIEETIKSFFTLVSSTITDNHGNKLELKDTNVKID